MTQVTPERQAMLSYMKGYLRNEIEKLSTHIKRVEEIEKDQLAIPLKGDSVDRTEVDPVRRKLLKRDKIKLTQFENASHSIEIGDDYGICKRCEESILIGRLEAMPATPFCADCASIIERENEKR